MGSIEIEIEDRLGITFCGNPLACAVATAVVNHLRAENMADKVASSGELLIDGLHKLKKKYPSLIGPIRGKGLLCAFELDSDHLVTKVTEAALRRGLLVTPTRNRIVRLIPALIVTGAEIARGLGIAGIRAGVSCYEALSKVDCFARVKNTQNWIDDDKKYSSVSGTAASR